MNRFHLTKRVRSVFLVFVILFLSYMTLIKDRTDLISLPQNIANEFMKIRLEMSVAQERGQGCVMPVLDPFSEEVMKFDEDLPKVVCEGTDWVECRGSQCYVVEKILKEMRDVTCIYKEIIYINDEKYHLAEDVQLYGNETYMLENSDHVKVSCSGIKANVSFFERFMPCIWFGYKAGFRDIITQIPRGRNNSLDVLILGFDTASRNGFLRRMPQSYKFLTKELSAVVFKGYNVVGDGTAAALFALLTGKTELELPDARKTLDVLKYNKIDPNYFIFNTMKADGYRTAYFEDMPWIGTFQHRFNGFEYQPADHYLRAMLLEESGRGTKWWRGIKGRYCMGAVPQYAWMLNLTSQFFQQTGKHFCFTMIADISHEDFNMITTADEDVTSFLRKFRDDGRLENTLLVVLGDHGARFSEVRKTFQGRLEERMPLLAIVLPERLKRDRPDVLAVMKENTDVLTTPFDVYTTVLDVVGKRGKWNYYRVPGSDLSRAMTLLQPIPKTRTCGEAGVLPHWCACATWQYLAISDQLYKRAAKELANYINKLTFDRRSQCEERKLMSISWVMRNGPNEDVLTYQGNIDPDSYLGKFEEVPVVRASIEYYQAKIIMSPGTAVYEGSMAYHVWKDTFKIADRDISRLNRYANESTCILKSHPHLDKYCYCKNNSEVINFNQIYDRISLFT